MKKNTLLTIMMALIIILGAYVILGPKGQTSATFDPADATYTIEGQTITLVAGEATTTAAPGSLTQITTTIFGSPAIGDLNGDGKADAAVILVQTPGGSGTFYYVAAVIATSTGAQGTNAIFLGDRIAPQDIKIQDGEILVDYADRKPDEPMSTPPSVAVSKYFIYNGSTLQEAARIAGPGERCGGNIATAPTCQAGYHCAPAAGSHLPFGDVGGTCVAN